MYVKELQIIASIYMQNQLICRKSYLHTNFANKELENMSEIYFMEYPLCCHCAHITGIRFFATFSCFFVSFYYYLLCTTLHDYNKKISFSRFHHTYIFILFVSMYTFPLVSFGYCWFNSLLADFWNSSHDCSSILVSVCVYLVKKREENDELLANIYQFINCNWAKRELRAKSKRIKKVYHGCVFFVFFVE